MGFLCSSAQEECPIIENRTEVRSGRMLHWKERWWSDKWEEVWVTLYQDSVLVWGEEGSEPKEGVKIAEAPEMFAAGVYVTKIPAKKPSWPERSSVKQAIAIGSRSDAKIHWLITKSETDLKQWLQAVSSTLPPPPTYQGQQPSYEPSLPSAPSLAAPPPPYSNPPPAQARPYPPQQQQGYPQQPQGYRGPHLQYAGGMMQPTGGMMQPTGGMMQPTGGMMVPGGGGNTTIIMDGGGGGGYRRNSGPGFGTGMAVGGLLGLGVGAAWGTGFGFGHGGGGGHGLGWGGGGGIYDNDTSISENNETNNTTINNYYGTQESGSSNTLPGVPDQVPGPPDQELDPSDQTLDPPDQALDPTAPDRDVPEDTSAQIDPFAPEEPELYSYEENNEPGYFEQDAGFYDGGYQDYNEGPTMDDYGGYDDGGGYDGGGYDDVGFDGGDFGF